MPLPALLGLPALIAWISTSISSVLVWIFSKFTYRIAILTVALTSISIATVALFDYFSEKVGSLIVSAPAELISASYILPSNTLTCLGIILGAEIACAVYSLTMRLIQLKIDAVT